MRGQKQKMYFVKRLLWNIISLRTFAFGLYESVERYHNESDYRDIINKKKRKTVKHLSLRKQTNKFDKIK